MHLLLTPAEQIIADDVPINMMEERQLKHKIVKIWAVTGRRDGNSTTPPADAAGNCPLRRKLL